MSVSVSSVSEDLSFSPVLTRLSRSPPPPDSPVCPCFSPDSPDGDQTFLRSVCDAVCGRGLVSADHHGGTHRVQAGHPPREGAALQILAPHQSGDTASL